MMTVLACVGAGAASLSKRACARLLAVLLVAALALGSLATPQAAAQGRAGADATTARPAAKLVRKPYLRTERVQECLKARGAYTGPVDGDASLATSRAVHKLLAELDPELQKSLAPPNRKSPELIVGAVQGRLVEACRKVLAEHDLKRARDPEDACGTAARYSDSRRACVCAANHERIAGVCLKKIANRTGPAVVSAARAPPIVTGSTAPPASASSPPAPPRLANAAPTPVSPRPTDPPPADVAPVTCLPPDLTKLVQARRPASNRSKLPSCELPCLAPPPDMKPEQLRQTEEQSGIAWCTDCVAFNTWLPLDDIERIERAGRLALCRQTPRTALGFDLPVRASAAQGFRGARALFQRRKPAVPHGDIAVLVTMSRYRQHPGAAPHAERDGVAMRTLLAERLGYQNGNIVELKDPTLADLARLFGPAETDLSAPPKKSALWERINARQTAPGATLLVYVSGLGAFRASDPGAFLLPVDAERGREETSSYPLARLLEHLGTLGVPAVTVLLEVDFGVAAGAPVLSPNTPMTTDRLLSADPKGRVTLITAADRDQRTLEDPEYGIGVFTRHIIAGLSGAADLAPFGNGDHSIDTVELFVHTAYRVDVAARRSFGVTQKPALFRPHTVPVARLSDVLN